MTGLPRDPAAPAAAYAGAAPARGRDDGPARPAGAADVRRARTPPSRARSVDARRRAAHPRLAQQGRHRGGRGRARWRDAVRHPREKDAVGSGAIDPDGILNVAITDVVAEVGDAADRDVATSASTSSPTTATAACSTPTAASTTTAPSRSTPQMARGPGRRRGRPGRAQRDDGRPGPRRYAGRSTPRSTTRSASWPTPRSTPPRSSAPSARPWTPRSRVTGRPTSRTPPTAARACARRCSTSTRAPTS